jgi:hypothetical protein
MRDTTDDEMCCRGGSSIDGDAPSRAPKEQVRFFNATSDEVLGCAA